ncbi:uncharacterized protein [Macaca nemestrina]|uniref:uncharacterized protein isoform X4 n=1 Tax=Macaca nemestrina TaxID=9545 RepID=UPI0039B88735
MREDVPGHRKFNEAAQGHPTKQLGSTQQYLKWALQSILWTKYKGKEPDPPHGHAFSETSLMTYFFMLSTDSTGRHRRLCSLQIDISCTISKNVLLRRATKSSQDRAIQRTTTLDCKSHIEGGSLICPECFLKVQGMMRKLLLKATFLKIQMPRRLLQ